MRRRIIAVAAVLLALVSFTTPGVASAHAILDSSNPAASTVIAESPAEIRLDFNEHIESSLLNVRLFDAAQKEITVERAELLGTDPSIVIAAIPDLADGVYVVVWRVVSADGHPISGAFPFEVGDKSSGTGNDLLTKILNNIDSESPLGNPLAASRFISFMSLVVLLGLVVFTWGTSLLTAEKARRLLRASILGVAFGSIAVLLLQGPYASGRGWGAIFDTQLISDVTATRLGLAVLLRLVFVVLWGYLAMNDVRANTRWWKYFAMSAAVGTIATFSLSGHPSAGSLPALFVLVDVIHVGAVSAWAGGLISLAVLRNEETADAARYSRIATWAMPIAVISGVVQGLHLLGGISGITDSSYGKFLLLKTAIVLAVIVLGAKARAQLVDSRGAQFGKTIRFEATLMVIVLAITALLVGTSPSERGTGGSQSFSATQIRSGIVADLSVLPTHVGTAEVHVVLTPPGGALKPVTEVTVEMSLPARDIPAIPVKLYELGPNHWTGVVNIPYSGTWLFESRVKPTANQTLLYTATFDVAD
jgi:copper transport protein